MSFTNNAETGTEGEPGMEPSGRLLLVNTTNVDLAEDGSGEEAGAQHPISLRTVGRDARIRRAPTLALPGSRCARQSSSAPANAQVQQQGRQTPQEDQ